MVFDNFQEYSKHLRQRPCTSESMLVIPFRYSEALSSQLVIHLVFHGILIFVCCNQKFLFLFSNIDLLVTVQSFSGLIPFPRSVCVIGQGRLFVYCSCIFVYDTGNECPYLSDVLHCRKFPAFARLSSGRNSV